MALKICIDCGEEFEAASVFIDTCDECELNEEFEDDEDEDEEEDDEF